MLDAVVCNFFPGIETRQSKELCASLSKFVAEGKDLLMHEISSEGDVSFLLATNSSFIYPLTFLLFFFLQLWHCGYHPRMSRTLYNKGKSR